MNHRQLLRFAVLMWAAPLVVASVVMLGYVFLRAQLFVAVGLVLLGVGGLCLIAGIVAVLLILATRNRFLESPRRYYKKPALAVLGLLLLNLPVALLYVVTGGLLLEPAAQLAVPSPSGHYLAEIVTLGEGDRPPYGQAVTLRPAPGLLRTPARTIVFSSYCLDPQPVWTGETRLEIRCADAHGMVARLPRYREVEIRYALGKRATPARRRPANSK
jgi:hypothetical protein